MAIGLDAIKEVPNDSTRNYYTIDDTPEKQTFQPPSSISKYHMHSGISSELSQRDNSDETP